MTLELGTWRLDRWILSGAENVELEQTMPVPAVAPLPRCPSLKSEKNVAPVSDLDSVMVTPLARDARKLVFPADGPVGSPRPRGLQP